MEDEDQYEVVVNHEEQYSIWLANKAIPEGWRATGCRGPKAECLAYIDEHWVDMRPLSVRSAAVTPGARGDGGAPHAAS